MFFYKYPAFTFYNNCLPSRPFSYARNQTTRHNRRKQLEISLSQQASKSIARKRFGEMKQSCGTGWCTRSTRCPVRLGIGLEYHTVGGRVEKNAKQAKSIARKRWQKFCCLHHQIISHALPCPFPYAFSALMSQPTTSTASHASPSTDAPTPKQGLYRDVVSVSLKYLALIILFYPLRPHPNHIGINVIRPPNLTHHHHHTLLSPQQPCPKSLPPASGAPAPGPQANHTPKLLLP